MTGRDDGFEDDTEYLLSTPANAENLRRSIAQLMKTGDREKVADLLRAESAAAREDEADRAEIQRIHRELDRPDPEVIDRVFELSRTIAEATKELNRILTEAWALDDWDYGESEPPHGPAASPDD